MAISGGSSPCEHQSSLFLILRSVLIDNSIGLWGLMVQNAAYAVVLPIYLAIYLSTSPLVWSKSILNLVVETRYLSALFPALFLGYILPTALMSLPAPSILSYEQKQTYMAIWQLFPIWVSIAYSMTPYMMPKPAETSSKQILHSRRVKALRTLYAGLLVIAGIGQASTATLLTTSKFFPDLFASQFRGVFNPSNVFFSATVSPFTKWSSIGSGASLLLQYDELIGSGAMVLWSTTLFMIVYRRTRKPQSKASLIVQGMMAMVLTGPLGYTAACIWARDEMLLADAEVDSDSKKAI